MKFAFLAVTAFAAISCSAPAAPTLLPPTKGWILAFAVEPGGACIDGATFEVVSGQGPVGSVFPQDPRCDAWAYGGGVYFADLILSVPMTLRASAPGYTTVEKAVTPRISGTAEIFELTIQRP
jgi:hypothetical protein